MACESHLKMYVQAFEKDPVYFNNKNGVFCKEKLVVYINLVLRKIG